MPQYHIGVNGISNKLTFLIRTGTSICVFYMLGRIRKCLVAKPVERVISEINAV